MVWYPITPPPPLKQIPRSPGLVRAGSNVRGLNNKNTFWS